MVANTDFRSLARLRRVALTIAWIAYLWRLLPLALGDARTICVFEHRASSVRAGRMRSWLALRKAIFTKSIELLRAIPYASPREDKQEDARVRRVLLRLAEACPSGGAGVPPLTADLAISVQAAIMRRIFRKLLGLSLTDQQSRVLGRYRDPCAVLLEFLAYCDLNDGVSFASWRISARLSLFVGRSERDLAVGDARNGVLHVYAQARAQAKKMGILGTLRIARIWLRQYACRVFWSEEDLWERHRSARALKHSKRIFAQGVREAKDSILARNRDDIYYVLVFAMHMRALIMLMTVADRIQVSTGEDLGYHAAQIRDALHLNFENALGDS